MSTLPWLSDFLEKRDCLDCKPDGRSLFAYRCTVEEFDSLRVLLAQKAQSPINYKNTSQLFALYCAEWWRRHYAGGPWKWEPILESLDWKNFTWSDRTELVRNGLRIWKRSLIETGSGTQYLLSVACEGGIPINVLEREATGFSNYLRAVINEYGQYANSGLRADRVARDNLYRLPSSWRQNQIATLAGQIVEQVWGLKTKVGDATEPVKILNELYPGWGQELPLELESEQAETLINSLLKTARSIASNDSQIIRIERSLEKGPSGWVLRARLVLPRELSKQQINMVGDLGAEHELPERFELYRIVDNGRLLVALLSGGGDKWQVRPVRGGLQYFTEHAEKDQGLVLVAHGQDVTSLAVAGGAELDLELPWCFVSTDDELEHFRWVGQGGCQRREPDIFVLSNQVPQPFSSHSRSQGNNGIDKVEDNILGRTLWWISNVAVLNDDQGRAVYRIEPGLEQIAARDYWLLGHRLYFPQTRFPLFHAMPNVQQVNEKSASLISNHELFWRPLGSRPWRDYNKTEMVGDIQLRHCKDKIALASWRLTVMPAQACIKVKPISQLEGEISFSIPSSPLIRNAVIDNAQGVTVETRELDNSWFFNCKRSDVSIGNIEGKFTWDNDCTMSFSFPYPAKGACFVDAEGKTLTDCCELISSRLYGFRAQAVSSSSTRKYQLSGSLITQSRYGLPTAIEYHQFTYTLNIDQYGISTLSLQQLKTEIDQLYAVSTGVDDKVKLQLSEYGSTKVEASVVIKQFEGRLLFIPNSSSRIVNLVTNTDLFPEYAGRSLELISVIDNTDERYYLDWNEKRKGWVLPDHAENRVDFSNTYFASIDGGNSARIRPCIIPPEMTLANNELSTLCTILVVGQENQRKERLTAFLSDFSRNGSEETCLELCAFLRRVASIHPTGVDLVECMLGFPDIIASVWFRSHSDHILQDYLQQICDTSPFDWWMISLDQWLTAAERWMNGFVKRINNDAVETMLIDECIKSLNQLCQDNDTLNVVTDIVTEKLGRELSSDSILVGIRNASLDASWSQLDRLCRNGDFIPDMERSWPKLEQVETLQHKIPECLNSLIQWPFDEINHKRSVIHAPVIAAATLHADLNLDKNERIALLAARNFYPPAFATIFRATQAILWVHNNEI